MFIDPMLLDTKEQVVDSPDFIYEPKSNGVRLQLISAPSGIKLFTRHKTDVTASLPEITSLSVEPGITLDGELVCYDPADPTYEDFEAVMQRIMTKRESSVKSAAKELPTTLIVFDILRYKDELKLDIPLYDRKNLLDKTVENQRHLTKVASVAGHGTTLFEIIKRHNLEGIVAKRADSIYYAGKRPKDIWNKIINWRYSECYITGYAKKEFGWHVSIEENGEMRFVGTVEFGPNMKHRKEFYSAAEAIKTGESKDSVYIQPVIRCRIKHRGFLRSGLAMTPVFVEWILV